MPRPALLALPLVAGLLALGGVSAAAASPADPAASSAKSRTHGVELRDIAFKPATVRIRRGDRVRWTWADGPSTPHNVVSKGKLKFKSASTRTDGTYQVTFRRKGTYAYVCTIHLGMRGKIVVR